jgi:hypothetical protein
MMLVSTLSARKSRAWAANSWLDQTWQGTACKDASVISTLAIISEKTWAMPELQTGKCGSGAQSDALLQ